MFLNVDDYDFATRLESNWLAIRTEFDSIPSARLMQWPEREIYDFGWRALPIVALGEAIAPNAALCPGTYELLKSIPNLVNAGFSVFAAGTHVHPHVGYTSTVYRFHLGLYVPENCGLKVNDEVRQWEAGKLLAFDDMLEHSAWNDSDQDRTILLFDVQRPGTQLEKSPSAMRAVHDILQRLSNEIKA